MSRRHTNIKLTPQHDHTIPDSIPFRNDLVFYAPLENPYCTHDYVSGVMPTTDYRDANNYGMVSWDNNVQMYRCRCQQSDSNLANMDAALNYTNLSLYSGVGNDNIANRGCTIFAKIRPISYSGNQYNSIIIMDDLHVSYSGYEGTSINIGTSDDIQANGTSKYWIRRVNMGMSNGTLYKIALTISPSGSVKWYNNGVVKATGNWGSKMKGNPSSIAIEQIILGTTYEENYIKDVRIYNRELTQSEIQQL